MLGWQPNLDLVGVIFGRLTVIKSVGIVNYRRVWECRCECGKTIRVLTSSLLTGNTQSCGCQRGYTTHGEARRSEITREHLAWSAMRSRCLSKTNTAYQSYGGRGIKIYGPWESFVVFLNDMGRCPAGYTLDRIDPNGDYEPNNCRWASRKEQTRNRNCTLTLTLDGVKRPLAEWTEITGIPYSTLKARTKRLGWSDAETLTTPVRKLTC